MVLILVAAGCDVPNTTESSPDAIMKMTNEFAPAAIPVVNDDVTPGAGLGTNEDFADAEAAIEAFAGSLQEELVTAMQESGPVNALGVCHTRAQPVAREVSEEHGMQLSRVSLKNRNPANSPNDWQARVLLDFEGRKINGEAITGLSYTEVVEQDGTRQFRFMKAIPIRAVCLTCHGTALAPDIKARLSELYPDDKATGFELGDIRGAFVVVKDLALQANQE